MDIHVSDTPEVMSNCAAETGAAYIRAALDQRGACNIIVATGASQFGVLAALADAPDIDWSKVTGFHLDEYLGLPIHHPASFRLYLWQRFVSRLPVPMKRFHFLNGESDADVVCKEAGELILAHPIDVAFIGIGENGHLAFNDPPADFETTDPYIVVELDAACRQQQVGEGWFGSMNEVPTHALSMSVQQILASRNLVCTVPDERKAQAVRNAVEGPVTPDVPASILQTHEHTALFLDTAAASKLGRPA